VENARASIGFLPALLRRLVTLRHEVPSLVQNRREGWCDAAAHCREKTVVEATELSARMVNRSLR